MICHVWRRLAAVVLPIVCLAPASSGLSLAAETTTEVSGQEFDDRFRSVMSDLAVRMFACAARSEGKAQTEVLFIGAPASNIHLDPAARRTLNAEAAKVVDTIKGFRANPIEPTGVLPSILRGGANAARQLSDMLAERYRAPVIMTFDTARPTPDVLQLQVNMLGRDAAGQYTCTETEVLHLDAHTFQERPRPPAEGDFVVLRGALLDAVRQMSGVIRSTKDLTVSAEAKLAGSCSLKRGIGRDVTNLLFDLKRSGAGLDILGSADWPKIRIGAQSETEPTADGHSLNVLAKPSPLGDNVLELTISLSDSGALLDLLRYQAVVPASRRDGCTEIVVAKVDEVPPPSVDPMSIQTTRAKAFERADFGLVSDRPSYSVNDRMVLTLTPPVDCRLTLINVDKAGNSCLLLPHPDVPDTLLKAKTPFRFPPRGAMRASASGEETFVALCNASPAAIATERRLTTSVPCADATTRPVEFETRTLETVVVDYEDDSPAPGDIIRRSLTVRIDE